MTSYVYPVLVAGGVGLLVWNAGSMAWATMQEDAKATQDAAGKTASIADDGRAANMGRLNPPNSSNVDGHTAFDFDDVEKPWCEPWTVMDNPNNMYFNPPVLQTGESNDGLIRTDMGEFYAQAPTGWISPDVPIMGTEWMNAISDWRAEHSEAAVAKHTASDIMRQAANFGQSYFS